MIAFKPVFVGLIIALAMIGRGQQILAQTAEHDSIRAWKMDALKAYEQSPTEAYRILDKSLKLAEEIGDQRGAYSIYEALGYLKMKDDKFEEALQAYQESIAIATAMDSTHLVGYGVQHLGSAYMRVGRLAKALEMCQQAYELFLEENDSLEQAVALGTMGIIYAELKEYDLADERYDQCWKLYEKLQEPRGQANVNLNRSHLYLVQGKGEEALPFVQSYLDFQKSIESKVGIAMGEGNLGKAYSLMGDSTLALKYYRSCLDSAKAYDWERIEYDTYKDLSETYADFGNHREALRYFRIYHALRDSVIGSETQGKIADLEVRFETAQKERRIEKLEQEKEITALRLWIAGLAAASALILTVVVFVSLRSRAKKNRALYEAEKQIAQNKLQQKELEKQKVEEELQYKSRHLTEFALDIRQKNELSKEIKCQLDGIEFTKISEENREKINELRTLISAHLQTSTDLDLFQQRVDEVNMNFNISLKKQFDELTENDLVLCGLLRLNLQNKEIASIRNVSDDAVKMARYRLRKKLNLTEDQDIAEFLRSV